MPRSEFSPRTKAKAFERANGSCEGCAAPLVGYKYQYDHVIADSHGGGNDLDNCQVICITCHREKTAKVDVPIAAKIKRIQRRERNIKKRPTFCGWRRFNGEIVRK